MPSRKLTKEENQPTITTLLPNCPTNAECRSVKCDSANTRANGDTLNNSGLVNSIESSCTEIELVSSETTADLAVNKQDNLGQTGFKEVKSAKKRKRKNHSSGSPPKNPPKKANMSEVNPTTIIQEAQTSPSPSPGKPNTPAPPEPIPEVILSPELLELERHINQTMMANIASGIKTALKPIQESIDNIQKSSDLILQQETRIKELTVENENLQTEVKKVKTELSEFKERLFNLENKSLECNLIFRGVEEPLNETAEGMKERLYWIIADTIDTSNPAERLSAAKEYSIRNCCRLGKANLVRLRPISVEFNRQCDADVIFDHRFYLTSGIFIDCEFNLETEKCRRTNECCQEGLRAKFTQNPTLLQMLLSTGDKLLVENSKDNIWGTGVPLFRWDCLQRRHWTGNGKLSDLLMEIHNSCKGTLAMDTSTSPD